jgi:hypothetical protein
MAVSHASEKEVTIFARIFGNGDGQLSDELARQLLVIQVSDKDKARMQELVERNQADELTPDEREEMIAFAKGTSLLGILKSKARRTLGVKLETHTVS